MPRMPKIKVLEHTKLANHYGGWMYCENCGETIGYLCYVNYDHFDFRYECKCGGKGHIQIAFDDVKETKKAELQLKRIKNRLCCPNDESPLCTILGHKLSTYQVAIDCVKCQMQYREEKI